MFVKAEERLGSYEEQAKSPSKREAVDLNATFTTSNKFLPLAPSHSQGSEFSQKT